MLSNAIPQSRLLFPRFPSPDVSSHHFHHIYRQMQFDNLGRSPLYLATMEPQSKCLKVLLDSKADPNRGGSERKSRTPLMSAAKCVQTKYVKLLLDAGAKANLKDSKNKTASDYAQDYNPKVRGAFSKSESDKKQVIRLLDSAWRRQDPATAPARRRSSNASTSSARSTPSRRQSMTPHKRVCSSESAPNLSTLKEEPTPRRKHMKVNKPDSSKRSCDRSCTSFFS